MARQERSPTLTFVGIDPGDVWCGFAMVRVCGRHWTADTAVYDRRQYAFPALTHLLLPATADVIVVERYHQRPVGHQAWATGETIQLIGALRYVTETRAVEWATVATGEPDKELPQLLIGSYLDAWRTHWPRPKTANWHHGRAAWRVLARYMLARYGELWSTLADPAALATLTTGTDQPRDALLHPDDLYAPTANWHVPVLPTKLSRV